MESVKENGKKSAGYSVWFSENNEGVWDLKPPFVLIWPSNDGWNDFGRKTHCKFVLRDHNEREHRGQILLAFVGSEEGLSHHLGLQEREQSWLPVKYDAFPQFFTMLPMMQEYRSLVGELDVEEAIKVLKIVNDLVQIRRSRSRPRWLKEALNSTAFSHSFMRQSESFFTYHNAGSILSGLAEERLGDVSNELVLKFKLDGFENKHQLKFSFDSESILPKRICIMIGENGVGKSQALNHMVSSVTKGRKELVDVEGGRPTISRLLAIGTPGETRNTFPREMARYSRINYQRLNLTRNSVGKPDRGFGELLVQLARSLESIKEYSRWELFVKATEKALSLEEIAVSCDSTTVEASNKYIYVDGKPFILLKDMPYGKRIDAWSLDVWNSVSVNNDPVRIVNDHAHPLSSGQLAFIRFAMQACLFVENGTLVLMDEPETHLHPSMIIDFIGLLDELLELTGSIAILATHSAYLVREVPRSQVQVMRKEDNQFIDIGLPRLRTFGADVGSISYFVFGDTTTNRLVSKLVSELSKRPDKGEELLKVLKSELSSEAIMSIRAELGLPNSQVGDQR